MAEFDYGTGTVKGTDAIDRTKSETSYARDRIPGSSSYDYIVKNKNQKGEIVDMSPKEYYERCAKIFNSSVDKLIKERNSDPNYIKELEDVIKVQKKQFPLPYIDYTRSQSQEGLHRMLALANIYGWDQKFPVLVIDWADKERHEQEEREHKEWSINHDKKVLGKALKIALDNDNYLEDEAEFLLNEIKRSINYSDLELIDKDDINIDIEGDIVKIGTPELFIKKYVSDLFIEPDDTEYKYDNLDDDELDSLLSDLDDDVLKDLFL